MILSVAMLMGWLGEQRRDAAASRVGDAIERAVDTVLASPGLRTADLGGPLGCKAFGERVASAV